MEIHELLRKSVGVKPKIKINGTISGNIDAQKITSGVLAVERIPDLSADKITSGVLAVERIPNLSIPNLSADKITSGVLAVERIPNLSADKITSGTINGTLTVNGLYISPENDDNYLKMYTRTYTEGYAGILLTHPNDNYGWLFRQSAPDNKFFITFWKQRKVDRNIVEIDRNGNAKFIGTVTAQTNLSSSDAKLKKNIQPIEKGLRKILSLRGVTFQWKEDKSSQQADRQLGLIAQEVETIFPEIVQMGDDGMISINYNGLIAPLIEAIKEQQEQISSLLMRLEEQQSQIEKLNSKEEW